MTICMNPNCGTPFCQGCAEEARPNLVIQDAIRSAILEARPWINNAELERIVLKHAKGVS